MRRKGTGEGENIIIIDDEDYLINFTVVPVINKINHVSRLPPAGPFSYFLAADQLFLPISGRDSFLAQVCFSVAAYAAGTRIWHIILAGSWASFTHVYYSSTAFKILFKGR